MPPLNPASLKWRVLIGCFLSYMFDAVDIIILAIAMPAITASLHITQAQAGLLVTATLVSIGLSSVVMGRLADTMGRRTALLLSLVSFGALTMAIAAATDWRQILLLRFLSGLGLGGSGARQRHMSTRPGPRTNADGPPLSCSAPFQQVLPSPPWPRPGCCRRTAGACCS